MADQTGRRIVVTGGASGIGRAAVETLASHGARVVVIDRDRDRGAALVTELADRDVAFEPADIGVEAEVAAAFARALDRLGGLDVLVHAAGIMAGQLADIRDLDEATWDRVVDVNLKGTFLAARHAAVPMLDAGRGVIVLVSSKAGVAVGSGSYPYGASKGGMHGLALTLDRHLGPRGIRVNELCPGDVDTPLYRASLAESVSHGADPVAVDEALRRLIPPTAIADIVDFLASEQAAAVRGTVFTA